MASNFALDIDIQTADVVIERERRKTAEELSRPGFGSDTFHLLELSLMGI